MNQGRWISKILQKKDLQYCPWLILSVNCSKHNYSIIHYIPSEDSHAYCAILLELYFTVNLMNKNSCFTSGEVLLITAHLKLIMDISDNSHQLQPIQLLSVLVSLNSMHLLQSFLSLSVPNKLQSYPPILKSVCRSLMSFLGDSFTSALSSAQTCVLRSRLLSALICTKGDVWLMFPMANN